jgi:hypothetical protein
MIRRLSSFEGRLMRAMGLKDVQQLDELLVAPISQCLRITRSHLTRNTI